MHPFYCTQSMFIHENKSCICGTQYSYKSNIKTCQLSKSFQLSTVPDVFNIEENLNVSIESDTWSDYNVIQFCQKYRVMYIMRGLPGSGKSTIAKQISKLFHSNDVVICSADDFRFNKDGVYVFDASKLYETHKKCQNKAQKYCMAGKTIIIDNTNLSKKDFEPYLSMAEQHHYLTLFVQTQETDTDVLYSRNVHNVPKQKIDAMKSNMERVVPFCFCWAIPKDEADRLKNFIEKNLFAWHHPLFILFLQQVGVNRFNLYDIFGNSCLFPIHVLSYYSTDKQNILKYGSSDSVRRHLGRVSQLNVIGYCITKNSLFARVKLTDKQKKVFCDIDCKGNTIQVDSRDIKYNKTIDTFKEYISSDIIVPDFGIGCTAYISLGIKNGMLPEQSRNDLMFLLDAELNSMPHLELKLNSGLLRCYKRDLWVVYLNNLNCFDTMFIAIV
ncbi:2',3'-cyclic-nucleotide 3'-phosphodiesterase isoform X1 [Hydra vulgaris]|uniref:2',3'-cyclic-nucleotide 3'-phosphodiesterase isoform X1 n=1 Tax=Hydra vulgaris TaxID=6087 RepID=UPI001F5F8AC3|nr:2',3'-cyclic-nucleotide 3'-phosphodiesterase isoform X1 [Hydra vulgaris]